MNNKLIKVAILALSMLGLPCLAQIVVIAHPAVTLVATDVHDVFVGDKQLAGGTKLVPVDNASLQDMFLASIVKVDANKYATIWTKKSFREGLTPPVVKATDAEVIDFVKRTPGAVGYVHQAPAGGVNIVAK